MKEQQMFVQNLRKFIKKPTQHPTETVNFITSMILYIYK